MKATTMNLTPILMLFAAAAWPQAPAVEQASSVPHAVMTPSPGPVPAVRVPVGSMMRVTDLRDATAYTTATYQATRQWPIPRNTWATAIKDRVFDKATGNPQQGVLNSYSKFPAVNADGSLLMAMMPGNLIGVWNLTANGFRGALAASATNGVTDSQEPRWSPLAGEESVIYYHAGAAIHRQDVRVGLASDVVIMIVATPGGAAMVNCGGEGNISRNGLWAAKFGDGTVGVVDLVNRRVLPGMVRQTPNAVDMSPSGRWLAILPHSGTLDMATRLYAVADLDSSSTSRPVLVPSPAVNRQRSIGHSGWAVTADGREVLVSRDNKADEVFYFDPATNDYQVIMHMGDWGYDYMEHFGVTAIPGWAMLSTVDGPGKWYGDQLMLLELKPAAQHPRVVRLGSTLNKHLNYTSEAFAAMSMDGKSSIVWGANWGGTTNLDVYRLDVPDLGSPAPTPTATPAPTPVVTPVPTPRPTTRIERRVLGRTVWSDSTDTLVIEHQARW